MIIIITYFRFSKLDMSNIKPIYDIINIVILSFGGIILYIVGIYLLKVNEVNEIFDMILIKLKRK